MCDTWWGIVEQSPNQYNFTGYVQLVNMAKSLGLQYQAVMSFHSVRPSFSWSAW
jgi:beta-amylase